MNSPSPAFLDLIEDDVIIKHQTAFRIYVLLLRNPLIARVPQPVKIWPLANKLKCKPETARLALNLLTRRGYVVETGRDDQGIREVLVPFFRAVNQTASPLNGPTKAMR